MFETYIAVLLDAACDLDIDLSARCQDHIRCMTGMEAEVPLDFLPDPLSMF